MTEQERWLPIPGWEGLYSVSDQGRVRRDVGGRILKPERCNKQGHLRVKLYRDSKMHRMLVHRLVVLAFVGPCPEGMIVCHNDGNPLNNNIKNLRCDTVRGNALDVHRHGHKFGDQKLCFEEVSEIRALIEDGGMSLRSISRAYGVSHTTIIHIKKGILWGHLLDQELENRPE